jgi:hypothetical protein
MSDNVPFIQPEPYAPALIRLLQGFVYDDDKNVWELLLRYQQAIEDYFGRMGLSLYINEPDGFAYLTQPSDLEDDSGGVIGLPRLTPRRALTYSVTLVLVVLREELNQFDSTNVDSVRLIIPKLRLIELLRPFYGQSNDDRQLLKQIQQDINQVAGMGFLKLIKQGNEESYQVRPVLKAKINSEQLELIKAQIETHEFDESLDDAAV